MSSTTTSEKVLSVRNLDLVFPLRHYRERTVRNVFVDLVSRPVDTLLKTRETLHILQDISFSVRKGERVGILGINGSGKTSLCRCIAGMLSPASGEIRIKGACRAVFDTQVGVIPELTGRENARLLATLLYPDESPVRIAELVDEATSFADLGEFLDAPFETYSMGMRARLMLSLITARPTELLILDEVYDNTDRFFQMKMTERLKRFIHSSDAVLFVSHSAGLLREICNRAIVIHRHKIAFDGPVEEALAEYDRLNAPAPSQA